VGGVSALAGLDHWCAAAPVLDGAVGPDSVALARYLSAGEQLLSLLPARPQRSCDQHAAAERLHATSRRCRIRFIERHAEPVYDRLTDGRTRYRRWPDLAVAGAAAFPGLVPTAAHLRDERRHRQADKEGREIDQGIFFWGLLRSPAVAAHLVDAMRLATPRALELLPALRRDGRLDLGTVSVDRRGPVAHLTINNQHCLNAEDDRLVGDLETAVDLALLDDRVRVGVLRGGVMTHPRYAGRRVFSAGINLRDLHAGRITFVDFLLAREAGCVNKLAHGLLADGVGGIPGRAVHKPWLAAVDSFAIGGGMQLLLVADRVVAADDAFFSLPAAREGLVPGLANLRLPTLVGGRLARRLILGGERLKATDPQATLLCDAVVPADDMDAAVEAHARDLDSPAVVANRRMLSLASEPFDRLREYLAEFAVTQAYRMYSRDVIDNVDRAWSSASTDRAEPPC
jgi:(3,5-dihydroxyphenyl)acetyl-CoA 1,2-dioxygenase